MRVASVLAIIVACTSAARAEPNYAPPGLSPIIQHEDDVSEIQQITGPPTAFMFGFGLGHVVEGRWHETGWKYTLVDTLSMGAMVVGAANTECERNCTVYGLVGVSGMLLGGVSRILQTIDTVTGARAKNRRVMRQRMQIAPLVLPTRAGDGAVAGVSLRF